MQLIYRDQSFNYVPPTNRFISPAAINWRSQLSGEVVEPSPAIAPRQVLLPAAINWRYKVPVIS